MYEALQHLKVPDLQRLLKALRMSASRKAPLLLASVPDKERLWEFYDTPARRGEYARRIREGTEAVGHWWTKTALSSAARECGYSCTFLQQNPFLHTAHYRFDALLTPVVPVSIP